MTDNKTLLGYTAGDSFVHKLSGASKLIFFILVSISCMVTYDTRLILTVALGSLILIRLSDIRWRDISLVLSFIAVFAGLNVLMVYLFAPQYGTEIYGSKDVLLQGFGAYNLTSQQAFYLLNLVLKYICTAPLAILFLKTTQPSQFAASLNQIGISYRIAYAVSLTLRYIPDIQEDYQLIKMSQEARGLELSPKASLMSRIKGNLNIILPLIFSSLSRIDTVSTAMELRRFGKNKKRTWYQAQALTSIDWLTICLAILIVIITLLLFWINQGRFYNPWNP